VVVKYKYNFILFFIIVGILDTNEFIGIFTIIV